MDVIRALLISKAQGTPEILEAYSNQLLAFHAQLLIDAKWVVGEVTYVHRDGETVPIEYFIERLTMQGHDFLSASRDAGIWNTAKKKVIASAGGWSLDILKQWLKIEAARHLSLPFG